MRNITGYGVKSHEEIMHPGAKMLAQHALSAGHGEAERTEDDDYADILVRMWSLATGRIPRLEVRPSQLTEQELLWFWDDVAAGPGRHARALPFPSGAPQ